MNLLGHAFVALATGDDHPDFVLGAVLPDLASMAGVRIDRSRLDGRHDRGVACHHRADAAFHAQPAFVSGAGSMRRALLDRGLRSGAARAVGHVGWELLLDGTLVGTAAHDAYRQALDGAEQAALGVDPPQRWAWFLGHRDQLRQLRYDDPERVAELLHRMLQRRPRLSFPAEHLLAVTEVLHGHAAEVSAAAGEVLNATIDGVLNPRQ